MPQNSLSQAKEENLQAKLNLYFKKKILKEKLVDLGPTRKLINEIVR